VSQKQPLLDCHVEELVAAAESQTVPKAGTKPNREVRIAFALRSRWAQPDDSNRTIGYILWKYDADAASAQI
jgi:hypothetical protein